MFAGVIVLLTVQVYVTQDQLERIPPHAEENVEVAGSTSGTGKEDGLKKRKRGGRE